MRKVLMLICVVLAIAFFWGCSNTQDIPRVSGPHPPPVAVSSFEDLHNLLLEAGDPDRHSTTIGTPERLIMHFGTPYGILRDMQYYFIPSWIPEGFDLHHIIIHNSYIAYWFKGSMLITHDLGDEPIVYFEQSTALEYSVDVRVMFRWWYPPNEGKPESIDGMGMHQGVEYIFVDGVENMYYYDRSSIRSSGLYVTRLYSWLQDGHFFNLELPLWTIGSSGSDGNVYVSREIHETIASSAQRVLLERH